MDCRNQGSPNKLGVEQKSSVVDVQFISILFVAKIIMCSKVGNDLSSTTRSKTSRVAAALLDPSWRPVRVVKVPWLRNPAPPWMVETCWNLVNKGINHLSSPINRCKISFIHCIYGFSIVLGMIVLDCNDLNVPSRQWCFVVRGIIPKWF